MSWSLGTCFVVSSSVLQQRAREKLFNRLWLSFPLGKLRSRHCPSWCWGSELNIAQGMHVGPCQEPLWEGGAFTVRGAAGSGMEGGAASPLRCGGLIALAGAKMRCGHELPPTTFPSPY